MSSGNRRALLMMIPFSTDDASCGRPQIVQVRIATGSASVFVMVQPSACGTDNSSRRVCQWSVMPFRNVGVNAPV